MEAIDPGSVARIGGSGVILTLSPPTRSKPAFWTLCHDGRRATVPAVEVEPPVQPAEAGWQLEIERGAGLALLVGDIGLANERVTIIRPNGIAEQVTSGSKPEYGKGGFEVYAQETGTYQVEFLDQSFEISISGQFTKAIFSKPA